MMHKNFTGKVSNPFKWRYLPLFMIVPYLYREVPSVIRVASESLLK